MNIKYWLWLLLLPLQAMARDPFQPPTAACRTAAPQWTYQGIVTVGEVPIGLITGPDGKWRRVRAGSVLPEGIHIISVSPDAIAAQAQDSCLPQPLRWEYQEKHHEGKPSMVITVATDDRRSGGRAQRVARGR